MFKLINKLKNRKGFTLVELIVVLAVLGIIMAIAVPKFTGIQAESNKKADAATAQLIIKSARLQEAQNNNGKIIVDKGETAEDDEALWNSDIMDYDTDKFDLTYNTEKYEVTWTANDETSQKVVEGEEFDLK